MSYTSRFLDPSEFSRLGELGIPSDKIAELSPETTIVGVVEDNDGKIVARWIAMNVIMMEGLLIASEYRHSPGVARKLITKMMVELRLRGVQAVTTIVQDDQIGELARHAGFTKVPGTLYQKDLR